MSPSPSSTPCRAPRRGRLLLVGGFTVPVIVLGSLLGAAPAIADGGVSSKSDLGAAFTAAAPSDPTVVSVSAPLTGDDATDDSLVVPDGADVTLQLNGNEVDLDSITIGTDAVLTVQDTDSTHPGLRVGTTASRPSSSTGGAGIVLQSGASLTLSSLRLDAAGSSGAAGIGQQGSSTGSVSITDGSVVTATGGAGGAGIGGGLHGDGLAHLSISDSEVTAAEGPLTQDATSETVAASAVGHGQDPDSGAGDVQLSNSTLHLPSGSTFDVAENSSLSLDENSTVDVAGTLTGTGTVSNSGSLVPTGSGTIDSDLDVTGNDYLLTFDANGGTTTAPATKRVYARTMAAAGFALSSTTGSSGDKSLVMWTNPYYGGWWWGWNDQNLDQIDLANLQRYSQRYDNTSWMTFTAQYERPITFTGSSMQKATLGTKFEQVLPVTGDATSFGISSYYDDDEDDEGGLSPFAARIVTDDDTLTGLPEGLRLNSRTGTVSGYPAQPGHYAFRVSAYSQFQFKSQLVTIDVAGAPAFATADLPGGTAGTAYKTQILAVGDGDEGSTTYSVSGGALPAGMSLSSAGVLSGTPTSAGSSTFGVKATNDYGSSKTAFTLLVAAGAPAPTVAPSPVLPVVAPAEVKLGSQFQLSVAANSTEVVTYSIPDGELPEGLALDPRTGLITGVPVQSGHFVAHVTAKSASGTTLRAYSIDVPKPTERVTGNVSRVTPKSGQSVKVAIRGLKVDERWTVFVDGKPAQTGKSKFGGTVFRTVKLAKASKDTQHVITVSGTNASADPSVLSSARLHVTVVATRKSLKLTRDGADFIVTDLAAKEKVTVKQGHRTLASGRADAAGTFHFTRTGLKAGKHVLKATGSTAGRTDVLTFTVKR